MLQGVVRVNLECMLAGKYEGQTGETPGCSKTEPLELDDAGISKGEEGYDKRARITTREKSSSDRERAPPGLAIHCGK